MSRLVGRVAELAELRAGIDQAQALAGRARLFVLVGEAGIGKTRIASETASIARELGVTPIWAACCDGVGAPPYWPFIQVVRELQPDLGPLGVPSLRGLLSVDNRSDAVSTFLKELDNDPDASRFGFFDRIATLLAAEARKRPLLII